MADSVEEDGLKPVKCPEQTTSVSPTATSSCSESAECVVCGDKSSGKHYGQFSCEGCKSFFKRSIRRSLSYTCRGTKNCPVDVHHRNQCQFCRLKKCVTMGMRKEVVRPDPKLLISAVQRGRVPPPTMNFGPSFFSFMRPPTTNMTSCMVNPFLESLLKNEQTFGRSVLPDRWAIESISEFGAQLLFSMIEWTRQMPFFAELTVVDQTTLLQNCWSQLFLLYLSQSPLLSQTMTTIATTRESTSTLDANELHLCAQNLQMQLDVVRSLHLDVAEMNCVKAAILFNPDTQSIRDRAKVASIQEKIQASLDDYCRIHKSAMPGRFGRILLRLPSLRAVDTVAVEQLFFTSLVSTISVANILKDLLQQQQQQQQQTPRLWPFSVFLPPPGLVMPPNCS